MTKTFNVEIAANGIIITLTNHYSTIVPGLAPTAPTTERFIYSDTDGIEKIQELIAAERDK